MNKHLKNVRRVSATHHRLEKSIVGNLPKVLYNGVECKIALPELSTVIQNKGSRYIQALFATKLLKGSESSPEKKGLDSGGARL